jgi:hypothetical protein
MVSFDEIPTTAEEIEEIEKDETAPMVETETGEDVNVNVKADADVDVDVDADDDHSWKELMGKDLMMKVSKGIVSYRIVSPSPMNNIYTY